MNRLFLWIAAASALVLQSCEKTDGIRDEIGKLSDRVAALETRVGEVNTSIEALHRLMDESTVIVGVTPDEKGYVLELSDGSKYLIIEGEKLDALVPLLNIDAEGYWIVSLDGGATFTRLLVDGSEVPAWPVADGEHAENASGITPRLRVAADGTWEVSLEAALPTNPCCRTASRSMPWAATSSSATAPSSRRWSMTRRADCSPSSCSRAGS